MCPSRRRELEMTDLSSESKMRAAMRSRRRRLKLGLAAALATMVLVAPTALARPAGAGAGAGLAHLGDGPSGVLTASATAPATSGVVLHRDGSKAVPFRAYPVASESSHRVALRRDGSKAEPFVADLAPTVAPAADGFDWGDAAVGGGAVMIVGLLGLAAIGAYGGHRARTA
jgi:hypothetical protein